MTGVSAGILPGAAFWILTHVWCHRRYLAMEAGDLEGLDAENPSAGLAEALVVGIGLGTVSPRAARLARDRGVISGAVCRKALSGAYRRSYDRTLAAEGPWLPVYIGMSMIGSLASPASSVLLSAVTSAAQCDSRFRVIPTGLALALVPLGLLAPPAPGEAHIGLRTAAAVGALAIVLTASIVARRKRASFGAGDLFLMACPVAALAGSRALFIFLACLTIELAVRALWGRKSAIARDIPLAVYIVVPMAIAHIAHTFM